MVCVKVVNTLLVPEPPRPCRPLSDGDDGGETRDQVT